MTNDTSTLNGALTELGELMATNLTRKGVTSTYDMGLTTLANRILLIDGGGVRTLTLVSDVDILSFADGDEATLTATLLEDGSGCYDETVTFKADGVSIGTATTDSNGVATLSYDSQGVGDVSLSASVGMLVSETYTIEDCKYYNENEVTKTNTNSSTIYDNNLSIALPTNCEISYDIWSDNTRTDGEHRYFIMPKSQYSSGTTQPQYAFFFDAYYNIAKFGKRESNSTVGITSTFPMSTQTYHRVKYVKTGTTVKMYVDDDLKATQIISWVDNYSDYCLSMMRWSTTGTSKMKNVKIKPF